MNKHLELFNTVVEGGMLDFARAVTLSHLLMQTAQVPGSVCEFGTFEAKSAALMASLTTKDVWLYDSFDGLPEPGPNDTNKAPFVRGTMALKDAEEHIGIRFESNGLKPPHIVVKEFRHLTCADLPDDGIAFAHVDGDMYESIKTVLDLIWPFVTSGGIVVVDDFCHPELPGVAHALMGFHQTIYHPLAIDGQLSIHAYLKKL